MKDFRPQHLDRRMEGDAAVITLNRPDRKNPLTSGSRAEPRGCFRDPVHAEDVPAAVFGGPGG